MAVHATLAHASQRKFPRWPALGFNPCRESAFMRWQSVATPPRIPPLRTGKADERVLHQVPPYRRPDGRGMDGMDGLGVGRGVGVGRTIGCSGRGPVSGRFGGGTTTLGG